MQLTQLTKVREGDMGSGVGTHNGFTRRAESADPVESVKADSGVEVVSGTNFPGAAEMSGGAEPILEISDKDYRSFCWPCIALEEGSDCKSGP
jgi:hypothetical protein